MNQLSNYTKDNFNEDYFHYIGNNSFFVRATLLPEMKEFTDDNNKMYFSINVKPKIAF